MAIANTRKRVIPPTHPGEMIREDFLPDYGLTTTSLALALGASRETINELVRERRAISPIMALKLARLFKNSPEFWMNAQRARDLWESEQQYQDQVREYCKLFQEFYRDKHVKGFLIYLDILKAEAVEPEQQSALAQSS